MTAIDTVTVASLNLHQGVSSSGTPFDAATAVCQLDAAVICVQEDWQPAGPDRDGCGPAEPRRHIAERNDRRPDVTSQLAGAAAKLNMSVHREMMCVWPAGELAIAVLTALPVAEYEVVELGTAPGDTIPRLAQVVLLALPAGRHLRLVNTHLTHRFTSPVQLLRLQRRLRRRLHQEPPTVIAGDLNMPRTIAAAWPGYADLVRGCTFPAQRPLIQLDHILAGRGIQGSNGRVLPSAGSDHLPIRAEIRLRGGRRPG